MALLDLLGRRWALRIVWELRETPASFRALRERCDGVSPAVLSQRLAELRAAGVVSLAAGDGYTLTTEGKCLVSSLAPLSDWAARWARRVRAR